MVTTDPGDSTQPAGQPPHPTSGLPAAHAGSSYWNASAPAPEFPRLSGDLQVDVAIIGGGIVGVTTARLLKDRGQKVAVIEAHRVGRQVTGKSTAKITSQHGLIYQTLDRKFGEEGARLYAQAQESGLRTILRLAAEHGIDCDIERCAAYAYTCDENRIPELEKELEVARRVGLPATLVRETGLPFEVLAALRYDDQARFHPTRYVAGLARTIPGDGSHVFEHSPATDWEPTRVITGQGRINARHVVMATHLPLGQVGGYYARAFPQAEPVLAARIGRVPEGMYITVEEPHRSIRTHRAAGGEVYAVAVGPSFKPGHTEDERRHFAELEDWLARRFEAGPAEYRWVNEDYWSTDSAPFVGWSSSESGYLVATGFSGWGITNGTAAATVLADLATGLENRWTEVFDAGRMKPVAGGPQFLKENLGVAAHLVGGYLSRKPHSLDDLAPGEAAILKIDGRNLAAYRDEGGQVHAVSAACSHMGCLLGWNATDRTWDCPCHGSRFALDGTVLHGPATRPLDPEVTDQPSEASLHAGKAPRGSIGPVRTGSPWARSWLSVQRGSRSFPGTGEWAVTRRAACGRRRVRRRSHEATGNEALRVAAAGGRRRDFSPRRFGPVVEMPPPGAFGRRGTGNRHAPGAAWV